MSSVSLPPAYTIRMLAASNYRGGSPFVCPVGMRAVVRHMDISVPDFITAAEFEIRINASVIIYVNFLVRPGAPYAFWDGYAVLLERDQVDVHMPNAGDSVDVQISGYLFQGP